MAKRRWLVQSLFVEEEATYLSEETLAGADAIRLMEPAEVSEPEYLDDGNREDWPRPGGNAQPLEDLPPLGAVVTISGRSPLAGAGSAYDDSTVYPMLHDLLLAGQLTATVDTSVGTENVTYQPATQDPVGVTVGFLLDGAIHKLVGAIADLSFVLEHGQRAVCEWELTGLYKTPADDASLSADFSGEVNAPVAKNMGFQWNSQSALIESYRVDVGNNITMLPSANQAEVANEGGGIAGHGVPTRVPTFAFNPESPLPGTYDYFSDRDNKNKRAIAMNAVGDNQYNKVEVTAPAAQIRSITPGERNGWAILDVSGVLVDSSGGDAFTLKFS